MIAGRRRELRRLLADLPSDWREAASSIGVTICIVDTLPTGAAFAVDHDALAIWVAPGDDGGAWSAWAGIVTIVAMNNGVGADLVDVCLIASEMRQDATSDVSSNSA